MLTAGVAVRTVDAAAMPRQPPPRFGVDVLAVAQVEHLAFERPLGLGIRVRPADLAAEYHSDRHRGLGYTVAPRRAGYETDAGSIGPITVPWSSLIRNAWPSA
jgi:hypothetical protein